MSAICVWQYFYFIVVVIISFFNLLLLLLNVVVVAVVVVVVVVVSVFILCKIYEHICCCCYNNTFVNTIRRLYVWHACQAYSHKLTRFMVITCTLCCMFNRNIVHCEKYDILCGTIALLYDFYDFYDFCCTFALIC